MRRASTANCSSSALRFLNQVLQINDAPAAAILLEILGIQDAFQRPFRRDSLATGMTHCFWRTGCPTATTTGCGQLLMFC
jgi:hypothetical protein